MTVSVCPAKSSARKILRQGLAMAETTMIMDETGRVYVRSLDSDSDNKEESVDGPPPESETAGDAHSVLESSPANKKSGNMDSKEQATVADKQIGGPSDHGLVNDLLQKGTPKKDQLFPMRSEMGEKDSRLVVRLSHGQVEAEATAEDDGQSNLLQENGKGHMTQSSIPNCEQSGTAIPMMKKDEARGKNTEICCTESMAQAVHKDACSPSVNVKSDLAERCQERSPCLENEALKQRPELLTAPEHTIAAQSLIVVKHDQTTDDSKSPSLRQHVLVEHVQNTERQQEDKQILQSGHEKNKTVPVVEVPDQLKRAETTSTHTGHQQVNDNVPLESQAHHKKDVDTKATKTEDASDVSAEKDKSINDVPNQRPESLIALEHGITGQHPTALTLDKTSCGEKSLPLEQDIQNVLEKQFCDTKTQASEEFSQKVASKQLVENSVSEEVQHKMPDLVGSSAACTAKAEQFNEDKTSALTEHIQNTEQQEDKKTLENGNECIGKNTVVPVADVPSQLKSAETRQTKTGHQLAENDPPLNINVHQKKSVDGETQTEELSQETLPSDVSHDMEQSANPEQPYYVEPPAPEYQEHLYLEPDDIGLQEDPCVRQQVERLDHVTLNIAITGMTGAGKSTFINAVRGVDNDDENAAPTGATETTMSACAYRHPTMPNVSLWDLPGTGSPKFKAKKYLKQVKFETYDFFIIISSERFKENDLMLAQEILKKKKKFYFLRSKIDNDIRAEQFKKNFDVDKLIACIREDLTAHLKRCIVTPTVFLVSSFDLDKYDFPILVDTLIADLPAHKTEALILSLPIYSTQMLERKIKSFEKTALKAAKAASGISMAPIPGLAVACDAGILLAFFSKCYHALGLDDKSLDKLSERVNNNSLKALRETRPFVMAIRNNELSGRELSALGSKRSALEFAYSLVPVWGSKRAANMSHSATLGLLNEGLKELSDTAREVLKVAKIDHIKGPCP